MSSRPIDPSSSIQRLRDDGYRVEKREQHLLLLDVPYVTSGRNIARGTLVCTYIESAGQLLPPDNHQVWWTEEFPCYANGRPIDQIRNEDQTRELFPGCLIRHRFSNKPVGLPSFSDHYSKMVHYATLLQAQAKAVDSTVDARADHAEPISSESVGPFAYADSASARAEIQAVSQRLALGRIAIIGVGGTGAYILDQLAKTPVREIHLYDGDEFLQHNAFRSPGSASIQEIANRPNKAVYLKGKYEAMHLGIVSHPYYVDSAHVGELVGFDFAFVCVDRGDSRRLLAEHLKSQRIPFIDVGMNLQLVHSTGKLIGSCRLTLCTPENSAHFDQYAPLDTEDDQDIYRQNVQVADMNALNAQLAVMKWKQHFGFYQDDFQALNIAFSVNSMSVAREALPLPPKP
jgi:ThiF family